MAPGEIYSPRWYLSFRREGPVKGAASVARSAAKKAAAKKAPAKKEPKKQ